MKKLILFAIILIGTMTVHAQSSNVPNLLNLVAVVRDTAGNPVTQEVDVKLEISAGAIYQGGTIKYCEQVQNIQPNLKGEIAVAYGYPVNTHSNTLCTNDTSMAQAQWQNGNAYYRLSWRITGGSYTLVDSGYFASVPYAFAARTAEQLVTQATRNGQVLTWDSIAGKWDAATLPGGGGTPYTAGTGINVSGGNVIYNTEQLSLNGNQLSLTNSGGNVVTLPTGTTYTQGTGISISGNSISTAAMGGDVIGNTTNDTVVKIQGTPVSSTAPTMNQVLQYNGTKWAPATNSASSAWSDYAEFQETQLSNVASLTTWPTLGSWSTAPVVLNTTQAIAGTSISMVSSTITLSPGRYYVRASTKFGAYLAQNTAFNVNLRLRNTTTNTSAIVGQGWQGQAPTTTNNTQYGILPLEGFIDVTGGSSQQFQLQNYYQTNGGTINLLNSVMVDFENEIYTDIFIQKVQ